MQKVSTRGPWCLSAIAWFVKIGIMENKMEATIVYWGCIPYITLGSWKIKWKLLLRV